MDFLFEEVIVSRQRLDFIHELPMKIETVLDLTEENATL